MTLFERKMYETANSIRRKIDSNEKIKPKNYPSKIDEISATGGGIFLTPNEIYLETRPLNWLDMPEPQGNELYLLFHIPNESSGLIAFTVTCTGNYTVEIGAVNNKTFVSDSTKTLTLASGEKYENELLANDFGNLNSNNMKQTMIKITGTDILTWEPSTHSKKQNPANFCSWNIVEIKGDLPSCTMVRCGSATKESALSKLTYFTLKGTNMITNMDRMFQYCYRLKTVLELDTSKVTSMLCTFNHCESLMTITSMDTSLVTTMSDLFSSCFNLISVYSLNSINVTNMNYMFAYCYNLTIIPELDTSKVTNMQKMFGNCYNLMTIPQIDTSKVTNMNEMFTLCHSLTTIPEMDTSKVSNMTKMFNACYNLSTVPELDMSSVTSLDNAFDGCYDLSKISFVSSNEGWSGVNISLADCSLGKDELVEIFNKLPTISGNKELNISGNIGVSELTESDKAIVTGKGWNLITE